jgi:hypothetical protein
MLWRRRALQCSQRRSTIANPDYPHRAWHNKKAKLEEKDASSISRKKGTKVNLVKYHCRLLIRGRSLVPEHFTDCAKAM